MMYRYLLIIHNNHFVFLLLILSFMNTQNVFAQNNSTPTFEQTVSYIISNTKGRVMYPGALDAYSRVKGYNLKDIFISKSGDITFKTEQKHDLNDFEIKFNVFDLVANTEYPQGVIAKDFLVHFNGLNVSKGYGIVYATQNDAIKVARAFRHLTTVCNKPDNDLFSVPIVEEKITLGKNATVNYISEIINGLGKNSFAFAEIDYYCVSQDAWGNVSADKGGSFSYGITKQTFASDSYTVNTSYDAANNFMYWNNILSSCNGKTVRGGNLSFPRYVEISYEYNLDLLESFTWDDSRYLKLKFPKNVIRYTTTSSNQVDRVLFYNDNDDTKYTTGTSTLGVVVYGITADQKERITKALNHLLSINKENNIKNRSNDPFGN